MRADDKQRAAEFVKELYAAGGIDEMRFEVGIARVLAATTDAELAEVVQSLPPPVAFTAADRRLSMPLEIHSGIGRLRLAGRWQLAADTHISADLGSVSSRLEPPVPGFPRIRLDVTTNIGRVRLQHPQAQDGSKRGRRARKSLAARNRTRLPRAQSRG